LNSASIDQLNAMGGGRIGKAIARARPYATPEDLLRKRVVNRATYARIKDQVTVQ
jgi:DNA uptake protein ComE-like DNA-binding protein